MKRLGIAMGLLALLLPAASEALGPRPQGEGFEPARFQTGQFPLLSPTAPNGGLVVIELHVAASGIVAGFTVVDDAPPYTESLQRVARLWKFRPAREGETPVESRVVVVALYRAPILLGGEPPPPRRVENPSGEVPYPIDTPTPVYPPNALFEGVAAVEVEVGPDGGVHDAGILTSAQGFDAQALEAARKFQFQPAKRQGRAATSYAILIFGFPQPVTGPRRR